MPRSKKIDPIPQHFKSVAEAGTFWDTHDLTDYWDQTHEVKGKVDVRRLGLLAEPAQKFMSEDKPGWEKG